MSAIDTLREARQWIAEDDPGEADTGGFHDSLMTRLDAALADVEALLEAAKAHVAHTAGYCVDKDAEADLTCPTHRALAAAVRQVEGD